MAESRLVEKESISNQINHSGDIPQTTVTAEQLVPKKKTVSNQQLFKRYFRIYFNPLRRGSILVRSWRAVRLIRTAESVRGLIIKACEFLDEFLRNLE